MLNSLHAVPPCVSAWLILLPVIQIYAQGCTGMPRYPYLTPPAPRPPPPCSYAQARTADHFLDFLKEKLEADKGFARVDDLNPLVEKFM